MKHYKIIDGSEVRGSDLRLPRAISIYRAALAHKQATVKSCRRKSDGSEVIIMELSRLEIPDEPEFPIHVKENIAVRCLKEDLNMPEVYAIRKDFPIGLPHSNAMPFAHPVSLCISDVLFADIKPQFNAFDFINLIIRWFNLNSIGELHEKGRPLEVFFQYHNFCGLLNKIPDYPPYYGLYKQILENASTLEFVDKSKANYGIFPIITAMNISRNFACFPNTMRELSQIKSLSGKEISEELLNSIERTSGKSKFHFAMLLMIQLKKANAKELEKLDVALIRVDVPICDVVQKKKIMKESSFSEWFLSLPIDIDMLLDYPSREINAKQNGKQIMWNAVTFIGTGTLGANVIDHFIREGVMNNLTIVDYDIYHSHNVSRHTLPPKDVMQLKTTAIKQQYRGIDGFKIRSIDKNVINLKQQEKEHALKQADLIVDASTSIAVERMLSSSKDCVNTRKCCIFLNPKGNDLILFMEDKERLQNLDLLEMSYLYNLLVKPNLYNHLDTTEQRRTNNFSCRSESNILDYDNVVMLSAVAAQQIQKQYIKSESTLAIWRVDNNDSTTQKIDLDILTWKHRDVGSISIWYSKELLLEIEKMKNKDLSKETGGCLFGCYDKTSNRIYVFYEHPAPIDSKCAQTFFERGCQGLSQVVKSIDERTFHQVRYLGEWHSHPYGSCNPSQTDKKQFEQMSSLLKQEDLPFVQMICGKDDIYINATF